MEHREEMSNLTNRGKLPKVVPPAPQSKSALGAQQLFPTTNVEIDVRPPFELRPSYTGRREVLDALEETFAKSIDSSSLGFTLLVGEAGMGKSRTRNPLWSSFQWLEERGRQTHPRNQCPAQYHRHHPFSRRQ